MSSTITVDCAMCGYTLEVPEDTEIPEEYAVLCGECGDLVEAFTANKKEGTLH